MFHYLQSSINLVTLDSLFVIKQVFVFLPQKKRKRKRKRVLILIGQIGNTCVALFA